MPGRQCGGESLISQQRPLDRGIIERFGRFPYRNQVLGRSSTPEERDWLSAGGSSFGQ